MDETIKKIMDAEISRDDRVSMTIDSLKESYEEARSKGLRVEEISEDQFRYIAEGDVTLLELKSFMDDRSYGILVCGAFAREASSISTNGLKRMTGLITTILMRRVMEENG